MRPFFINFKLSYLLREATSEHKLMIAILDQLILIRSHCRKKMMTIKAVVPLARASGGVLQNEVTSRVDKGGSLPNPSTYHLPT